MLSIGNSLGMDVQQVRAGAYIPTGWKIVHPSHSVAQYRGVTWCWNCAAWTSRSLCKLSTQWFGSHQVFGTRCAEQNQNELATTSDGSRGAAGVALDSTSECGSSDLISLPFCEVEAHLHWCLSSAHLCGTRAQSEHAEWGRVLVVFSCVRCAVFASNAVL